MHAEAETEVPAWISVDVEGVGIVDERGIPIPCGQIHQHVLACPDELTVDSEIFKGDTVHLGVHDGQVAHQLLDDVGDQGRVVGLAQPFQCVGMLQ